MLDLRWVMWSFYFPHRKHIHVCAIWRHDLSTNSGNSYGHKLCSTHSGFVILSQQRWRGYSNAVVRGWMGERVSGCVGELVGPSRFTLWTDTIATTVFDQSLSNFTCQLWMMRGGTLLILGHGIKGQSKLWHSVYKTLWTRYRLQI